MITGFQLPFRTSRAFLALGASVIALSVTAPAFAQEASVQILRHATEIADGDSITSISNDMLVARKRVGDRSMLIYDPLNGAITVERGDSIDITPLISERGPEAAVAYDYRTHTLSAEEGPANAFNTRLRPIALQSPALGANAAWSVSTTLAAIGVRDTASPVTLDLSRTYLQVDGKPAILFEYNIPAFKYVTPAGETVVHWARGLALTDDKLSAIHVLATQHRASVIGKDGTLRPVSVKRSIHAVDKAGDWTIDLANAPQVRAALDRMLAVAGDDVPQIATDLESPAPDSFPATVAQTLDMAALAAAEGGANPLPTTLGAFGGGYPTTDPNAAETLDDPYGLREPADADTSTTTVRKRIRIRRNTGEAPVPAPSSDTSDTSLDYSTLVRSSEQSSLTRAYLQYLNGEEAESAGSQTNAKARMLEGLNVYIQNDYDLMRVNPDDGALTYRTAEERQLTDTINSMLQNASSGGTNTGGNGGADLGRALAIQKSLLRQLISNGQGDSQAADSVRDQMLRDLLMHVNSDAPLQLDGDASPGRFNANSLVASPPGGFGGEMPGWIEPGSPDAATFAELMAQLDLSLDEIMSLIDDAPDKRSGISSLDEFVNNNAFDYLSMVGIVETDLSRWAGWLATQNVRELERLASLIGYPNLASALADAENIILRSEDPGYRQWAMQAPSCGGYVGCGPNYLERWWAKQANVALGDILADSRDIFSSGGFSDIGISGLNLAYLLRDHALEDGDIVQIRITQFGRVIYEGQVNLTNAGEMFDLIVGRGVASLEIFAVNEGYSSPNTAQITVENVVRGEATQTYSLQTGQTATLRIEAGAKPAPSTGTSGAGQ